MTSRHLITWTLLAARHPGHAGMFWSQIEDAASPRRPRPQVTPAPQPQPTPVEEPKVNPPITPPAQPPVTPPVAPPPEEKPTPLPQPPVTPVPTPRPTRPRPTTPVAPAPTPAPPPAFGEILTPAQQVELRQTCDRSSRSAQHALQQLAALQAQCRPDGHRQPRAIVPETGRGCSHQRSLHRRPAGPARRTAGPKPSELSSVNKKGRGFRPGYQEGTS